MFENFAPFETAIVVSSVMIGAGIASCFIALWLEDV